MCTDRCSVVPFPRKQGRTEADRDGRSRSTGPKVRAANPLPDERSLKALMVQALAGDKAGYLLLLRRVRVLLTLYYSRRVREVSDGEDLVQAVLLAIHERRHTYDPGRPFTPWMFGIARHKLADHRRIAGRYLPLGGDEMALTTPSFEASSAARLDVENLLTFLPPKQSEAIRRTRVNGWSVAEAASAMRIGDSDVKVSAHRGLSKLAAMVHRSPSIGCGLGR